MARKVRFASSALDGKTVTLTAMQEGVTRGPLTVSAWGGTSEWAGPELDETLVVSVEEVIPSADAFAPLPVEWRIKVSGSVYGDTPAYWEGEAGLNVWDPTYQKVHYVVHTGDSGNYRNEWVGHASHRDKRYQYGQNCGHVYSEPGTYTDRRIYVYDDDGKWGTLALDDLVVADPTDVIPAAATILLASDGVYTGAPHEASVPLANKVTTFDAAAARYAAIKMYVNGPVRICAKAGDTFTEVSRQIRTPESTGRLLVDTWGSGGQATYSERNQDGAAIESLFRSQESTGWPWSVKNWKFDLGYDVATGGPTNSGGWEDNPRYKPVFRCSNERDFDPSDNGKRFVLDNVDVTGAQMVIESTSGFIARNSGWFVNDCDFYDSNDYTMYQGSNFFCLGTRLRTTYGNDLGLMGRNRIMGTTQGYHQHSILIRESTAWTIYIRASYAENRGGWSGDLTGDTIYTAQPLTRILERSGADVDPGKRVYVCDSILMGKLNMDLDHELADTGINGIHSIAENCVFFYDPASFAGECIDGVGGRKSIRNNIFVALNTPPAPGQSGKNLSKFERGAPSQSVGNFERFYLVNDLNNAYDDPMEVLHNTFVMLRSDANLLTGWEVRNANVNMWNVADQTVESTYHVVEGHNVTYAPNVTTPQGPAMDTLDLPTGVRVLDVWMKTVWERATFTLVSDLANGATSPAIPYPADWTNAATTGADYAGSRNNNGVTAGGTNYAQLPDTYQNAPAAPAGGADALTINHDLDASGNLVGDGSGTHFSVTNRSGVTWPAGEIIIILDRGTTCMEPDLLHDVDQTEVKLYRSSAAQSLDAGVKSSLFDFQRRLRPNAGYAISPSSGTNAAGAILP